MSQRLLSVIFNIYHFTLVPVLLYLSVHPIYPFVYLSPQSSVPVFTLFLQREVWGGHILPESSCSGVLCCRTDVWSWQIIKNLTTCCLSNWWPWWAQANFIQNLMHSNTSIFKSFLFNPFYLILIISSLSFLLFFSTPLTSLTFTPYYYNAIWMFITSQTHLIHTLP